MIDVPAHIQYASAVSNGVQTLSGTNWDLGRSAVATPIAPLPEPVEPAVPQPPAYAEVILPPSSVTVRFAKASAALTSTDIAELCRLEKGARHQVTALAQPTEPKARALAAKRGQVVRAALVQCGVEVKSVVTRVAKSEASARVVLSIR